MPTKFSEFFTLATTADGFQKRIYSTISDATTIVDCYILLYRYMVAGLRGVSRKARYDSMDNTVDATGFNQAQVKDAEEYLSELTDLATAAWFEYLDITHPDKVNFGDNVFNLAFNAGNTAVAQKVIRQVQLYFQMLIYNEEYDTQAAYQAANSTTTMALPNSKIKLDPAAPVNPDDATQITTLTTWVDQLVNWIEANYPYLKAVLAAKETDLFVVIQNLPDTQKAEAFCDLLEKIRNLGDSKPASTHKAFGLSVLGKLKANSTFWNNAKVSAAFQQALSLEAAFTGNTHSNLALFTHFQKLFTDFLNPGKYEGELDADAQTRRHNAVTYITGFFQDFSATSGLNKTILSRFKEMLADGLVLIQDNFSEHHTSKLLQARAKLPQNGDVNPILQEWMASTLKTKADEFLRTLPLEVNKIAVSFFAIQDYAALCALNNKSVHLDRGNLTKVEVPADPEDGNAEKDRPIYRAIRFGDTLDCYIGFCNLPNLAPGTFYYRHLDAPAVVNVATLDGSKILTLDFQNYTIAYPGKADSTKNDAGQPYRSFGSVTNFYDELKARTKWGRIAAIRRYDPYYVTNPADPANPVPRLTGFVAAGMKPIRALPMNDCLCLWSWNYSDKSDRATYPKLGEVLELPADRQIVTLPSLNDPNKTYQVQIGALQCTLVDYGLRTFKPNGFCYQFIGVKFPGKDEDFYVRVNTPFVGVAAVLTRHKASPASPSRPLESKPEAMLNRFDFSYFRRITASRDPTTQDPVFDNSKVIQLFTRGDRRRPSGAGTVKLNWTDTTYEAIGTNLPICFNLPDNIKHYFLDKQTRGKIINKGNVLFRERRPRKDAGAAMKPIQDVLTSPLSTQLTGPTVPATTFANKVMTHSAAARQDWGTLKTDASNYLPVNQEWCHLRGHGDGGDEYPGNFVSGSLHCNTEQLAIEEGQRLVTYYQLEGAYVLHTTAYLLRDATNYQSSVVTERESQILAGNYLSNQTTYQTMLAMNTARRSRELTPSDDNSPKAPRTNSDTAQTSAPQGTPAQPAPPQQSFPRAGSVAPVAAYIRYKVMATGLSAAMKRTRTDEAGRRLKVFDFIFEGQSEFIDAHQVTLISQAVHYALAGQDQFATWYAQRKAELAAT